MQKLLSTLLGQAVALKTKPAQMAVNNFVQQTFALCCSFNQPKDEDRAKMSGRNTNICEINVTTPVVMWLRLVRANVKDRMLLLENSLQSKDC